MATKKQVKETYYESIIRQGYSRRDFMKFATEFRPLVLTQENKLMTAAPWTPVE